MAFLAFLVPGAFADGLVFTVNSPGDNVAGSCDAAHCTLREAILDANAAPGHDTIEFEISGNGVHTILAAGSPPIITNPVTIDATTEDDYAGVPRVEIDGVSTGGANGLFFSVNSGASTVRGLGINRWGPGIFTQDGVSLTVEDSYVGVSAGDGVTPRPNQNGIVLLGGSNHVVVGNLISGNQQTGLRIGAVSGATIQGNRIGTNAAGTAALANGVNDGFNFFSGVEIGPTFSGGAATGIVIGGAGAGQGNLISGNGRSGIDFTSAQGSTVDDAVIRGNLIGTNAAGTAAIANGWHGIHIRGNGVNGATTDTSIGGTGAGQGNTIAFNGRDGIAIETNAPAPENLRNSIRGNSIHSNDTPFGFPDLGIDLDAAPATGVTANDALDTDGGANELQNFPVLTSVTSGGDQTIVDGTLGSRPSADYALDFFVNAACDASGNGEGAMLIGSTTTVTNGEGDATFHVEFAGLLDVDDFVTATATDPNGNTSEFSACEAVEAGSGDPQPGPTYTVNTTGDAAPGDAGCSTVDCTLREAIEAANAQAGSNTIELNIPGAGVRTIAPTTPLPTITDPIVITADASNLDPSGLPFVRLDGANFGTGSPAINGLELNIPETEASAISGLAFTRWTRGNALGLSIVGASPVSVSGSLIGTDQTGALGLGNYGGMRVSNASTIGGNVIVGSTFPGIWVLGGSGALIQGNWIGVGPDGVTPNGNGRGVQIDGSASSVTVGGSTAAGNLIRNNGVGVKVFSGSAVSIRQNSITENQGIGIDLGSLVAFNGVTPNDPPANLDADTGPNDLQNFPILSDATSTQVSGVLDSAPNLTYEIDLYTSVSCDASGHGEGTTHIGEFQRATNASGHADFTFFVSPGAGVVTATATDSSGNTSEFSPCEAVVTEQPGPTFTVNTTADAAPADAGCSPTDCTLREAIDAANAQAGANTIAFDIAPGGHQTITPELALPAIAESVTIDGTSQPGFTGTPIVEIDGSTMAGGDGGDGLTLAGGSSTVRGLVVNGFDVGVGILITSNNNVVGGNYVGTDVTGTVARPNGHGIEVVGADNTIGGTTEAARNVISANTFSNVRLDGDAASGNDVVGNYVGTTASGIGPLGGEGIVITFAAHDNTIGGPLAGQRNVISGNIGNAVEITNNGTIGNVVEGNYIGLGATGLGAVFNEGAGVEIVGPDSDNTVRDNWITGNIDGVVVGGNDTSTSGQVIEANRIGLTTGVVVEGNLGRGIYVNGRSAGNTSDNSILSNTIAGSGDAGIFIDATEGAATGNTIRFNSIEQNGELGIDLVEDVGGFAISGVTQNDAGDADTGPNGLQNFPVLTSATVGADTTAIQGNLSSTPNTTFTVDFYASDVCDPSGHGEGQLPIGAAGPVTTDVNGDATFMQVVAGALGPTAQVTATATAVQSADTSEFSACLAVQGAPQTGPTFTVNTTADATPADAGCTTFDCTLREAMEEASQTPEDANTIEFDITGDTPHTIVPETHLPTLDGPVTIDGTTQPGHVDVPVIEIDGTLVTASPGANKSGIVIDGGESTIRGLVINRFSAPGAAGIEVDGNLSIVDQNYVGTDITGSVASPNDIGVLVRGDENTIGLIPGGGNLISGNASQGLLLEDSSFSVVHGNRIGTNEAGTAALPNNIGIEISTTDLEPAVANDIGDDGAGEGNLISGNTSAGILLRSSGVGGGGAQQTNIEGNLIGTAADGTADLGNGGDGIQLGAGGGNSDNTIGGDAEEHDENTIAFNDGAGVAILDAPGNRLNEIQGNSIHSNGGLGIDLGADGVVAPHDGGDGDAGANDLQNFPFLSSAISDGSTTTIAGALASAPDTPFTFDVYASPDCDPSGFGEGAIHLGSTAALTTNGGGDVEFEATFPGALASGTQVTATATEAVFEQQGNTSEFSACITANPLQPGPIYTVNSNADASPVDEGCTFPDCTFREAIQAANTDGTPSTIEFDMSDSEIVLDSGLLLPVITAQVVIAGTTQSGGSVQLNGGGLGGQGLGLVSGSSGSTVTGLEISNFSSSDGIILSNSSNNTIVGNSISSVGRGIVVHGFSSTHNVIGGSRAAGAGNRIWDFEFYGVDVNVARFTRIAGNTIGLDPNDAADGGDAGIRVNNASGTVIGHHVGPDGLGLIDYDRANVLVGGSLTPIQDQRGTGIAIVGASEGSIVAGNFVGTDETGRTDVGNLNHGIRVAGNSTGNQLGPGNVIAHNGVNGTGDGVAVESSVSNRIVANSIHSNGDRGIALTSANRGISAPAFEAATVFGGSARIDVSVEGPAGTSYFLEIFKNSTCAPDGEGETFATFATITPGASGRVAVYTGGFAVDDLVTGTLTNTATGDTSEFSNCVAVVDGAPAQGGPTFTVNTAPDDLSPIDAGCTTSECTLREAIVAANAVGGLNTIAFGFDGFQIGLSEALPEITDPVVVDGTTQAVQINGSDTDGVADGLVLAAGSGGSTIRGIDFRLFTDTPEAAIRIGSANNLIIENTIDEVETGIVVSGVAAANNLIGSPGNGNTLSGIEDVGVRLQSASTGNKLWGNQIGTDHQIQSGGNVGVAVVDTPGTIIGADVGPNVPPETVDESFGNVVVGTFVDGISISGGGSTSTKVAGNFVGIGRGVGGPLGSAVGVHIVQAPNSQIGPANTLTNNGSHGVEVSIGTGNRIVGNSIFDNGGAGIFLSNGGNNGLAPPELLSATLTGGSTRIEGSVDDDPDLSFIVEAFANDSCDGSAGEGETFLGRFALTPGGGFNLDIPDLALGDVITATATEANRDDTSSFSNCVTVTDVAPPPAPVLFGAVVDATDPPPVDGTDPPPTLGVAGLIDSGQPSAGQAFDVEFFSTTACDPLAPKVSLGTGDNFLTNQTGVAGFAKDGLTNVEIGTFVVAYATRGESAPSQMSNCVVADRNNTSWHTALDLSPTDSDAGAVRAAGEGRWFKVPILPNSRVELSVSNLPADYDVIAFSDIQQAYERLQGTDVDPQLGPNLARTDLDREGAETQTDVFNTSQYDSSSWDPTNWDPNLNTSVFSASQWSASQWSPSQWSASQWSPSQWSASQWSPSQWSASQWSASQWSPSQWSASQWSPSQWSSSNPADPRAFSSAQTASLLAVSAGPGTGDETISVNTWNNTGHFYFRVQGKNGSFDADEAFSISVDRVGSLCEGVLDQSSNPTAPAGLGEPKTLILKDTRRLAMGTVIDGSTLNSRLDTLADRPDVDGVVVDVDTDPVVRSLNTQADAPAHRSCPYAKNLVASAIKRIVSAYRKAYPSIKYLVVVGDDTVIPFHRYPDPALMGSETLYVPPVRDDTTSQASLRLGYVLSDDFLASSTSISRHGKKLPVPDLSAGRLVETPQEIAGMLDAYLGTQGGVVPTPTSSFTTGYDFLTDAADEIAGHFEAGIGGSANRKLITEQTISPGVTTPPNTAPTRDKSWTGNDLRNALLGPNRHDLVFLAGHFSANDALAADYKTNVLTTDLAASSTDFENSIVFSAGCHAGYNIVNGHATEWTEPLDWAQAFARKRATLISGTGYQYGDTDFLAHGEVIYAEFARQLRVTTVPGGGREPVAVGHALLRAKQIFLKETPGLTSLDEKSLLQTTLFGLPMLSVDLPQGRFEEEESDPLFEEEEDLETVGSGPGRALGLKTGDASLSAPLSPDSKQLKDGPLATWLEGPDGVAVRPTQPILPLKSFDVTSPDPDAALRGTAIRTMRYVDTPETTPLTAAPATELRGIHAPFFSDVFFPTVPWSVNYFDALAGGSTFLHLTPVQHRSESPTMTQREITDLGLQFFYSGNVQSYCPGALPLLPTPPACAGDLVAVTPALAAPPTISGVETSFADGKLTFKARVVGDPSAGVQEVLFTWTIPPGAGEEGVWATVDGVRDATDSALWTGELELGAGVDPGDVHFFVQAVNGVGRVTVDNNVGAMYRPGSIPGNANTPPDADDPVATELTLTTPPPASVTYGQSFDVTVRLISEGAALEGRFVSIGIGPNGIPVRTTSTGHATLTLQASLAPGSYEVEASFPGDATHGSSDVSAPVVVAPRGTSLTLGGTVGPAAHVGLPAVHAILQATAPPTPLHQRSVFVVFDGTGPVNTSVIEVFAGKTDPQGRVDVPSAFLLTLPPGNYKVDAYFNGVNIPGVLFLPKDSPEYAPATANTTLGVHPRPLDLLTQAAALLQPLAALPGARGDKAEDALMKVQSAISKLNRATPDRQGALGDIEGAVGDLESALQSRLFTAAQVRPIQHALTAAAWVIAVDARQRAINRNGNATKIADAQRLINTGNQRWAANRFKEAVANYKSATAKADSA